MSIEANDPIPDVNVPFVGGITFKELLISTKKILESHQSIVKIYLNAINFEAVGDDLDSVLKLFNIIRGGSENDTVLKARVSDALARQLSRNSVESIEDIVEAIASETPIVDQYPTIDFTTPPYSLPQEFIGLRIGLTLPTLLDAPLLANIKSNVQRYKSAGIPTFYGYVTLYTESIPAVDFDETNFTVELSGGDFDDLVSAMDVIDLIGFDGTYNFFETAFTGSTGEVLTEHKPTYADGFAYSFTIGTSLIGDRIGGDASLVEGADVGFAEDNNWLLSWTQDYT